MPHFDFKVGQKIVRFTSTPGHESAALDEIKSIEGGRILLQGSSLAFDGTTGLEVDPASPTFSFRIMPLDD
jgi:hypothetical protein